MTDSNAIRVIANLMQRNAATGADDTVVADVLLRHPWFVPARYIQAAEAHAKKAYSAEMLTTVHAYTGNWLMFLDHINRVKIEGQVTTVPVIEVYEEVISPALQQEMADTAEDAEVEDAVVEDSTLQEPEVEEQALPQTTATAIAEDVAVKENKEETKETVIEELVFTPVQSDDYFKQQGIDISNDFTGDIHDLANGHETEGDDKDVRSLMVMMSFSEWLVHFKRTADKKNEEIEDQKAVRAMWQKEKLAAALQEENDEIPDNVFEMAVNSIAKEEGLASESLAEIYLKQGKHDQAIEMYKKLSLRNPQKNAYFAAKIDEIIKEKK